MTYVVEITVLTVVVLPLTTMTVCVGIEVDIVVLLDILMDGIMEVVNTVEDDGNEDVVGSDVDDVSEEEDVESVVVVVVVELSCELEEDVGSAVVVLSGSEDDDDDDDCSEEVVVGGREDVTWLELDVGVDVSDD